MKASKIIKYCFKPVFLMGSMLLIVSCSQKSFDSKEELMAHIMDPENGYTQAKSINGVDFSITYRPSDLLVAQELSENATEHEIDSLRSKYGKYLYFNLSLSKNNKEVLNSMAGSRSDFGVMVNQLAFGMGDKVNFISRGRDTLELLDYNYPRIYGMGGGTNMLLVYPKDQKLMDGDYAQLTIEDIGLNTGEVGFKIPADILRSDARLNF